MPQNLRTMSTGLEGGCGLTQGLAEGEDWVPAGGCGHAPAVADGVDAAEHPHGLRSVPDRVSQHPLDPWRKARLTPLPALPRSVYTVAAVTGQRKDYCMLM